MLVYLTSAVILELVTVLSVDCAPNVVTRRLRDETAFTVLPTFRACMIILCQFTPSVIRILTNDDVSAEFSAFLLSGRIMGAVALRRISIDVGNDVSPVRRGL